jgi:beta-lactamase class A
MSEERLRKQLDAAKAWYSGQYSIAARNLKTGEEILVDEHRVYPTASTFKVPIMVEVFRQVEAGEYRLDDRIEFKESDKVEGSGVLRDMTAGLNPTIHDLLMLMIIVSDNTATNMLIDKAGRERINATMQELGFTSIDIVHKIDFEFMDGDGRKLAVAAPWDLMRIMDKIVRLEMWSKEASEGMLEILGRQHYMGQGPRYLGYNPYAENKTMWVGNKTGSLSGMRADTVLVRLANGTDIAFAVMNEGCADPGFGSEYEGDILNGILGWIIVNHWWPEEELGAMPGGKSPYLDAALGDARV